MGSPSNWCTIESDPGVFTELMETWGVKDVQCEELYSLDEDTFSHLKPIHGLIFLFKWRPEADNRKPETGHNLFFANQVINDACATQALLSILLNIPVEIGETLTNFKNFTEGFPSEMKGLAISNSDTIREAHNSFARPEPFVMDDRAGGKKEDAFHFISYIPHEGKLYELDGLQEGPIILDECTDDDWMTKVAPIIQKRIEKYSKSEIRFNLMAVLKSRKVVYEEQLAALTGVDNADGNAMDVDSATGEEVARLRRQIVEEEEKHAMWKAENVRRRFNYIPFIVNLLKVLGEKGELVPLVDKALENSRQNESK
eukprot:TRINITY_DN14865_c0_g1_i1.p1 TRINITY_DN14865_c0_g1~~TRINITY_DN14865_c0_g1_i1.p1  ORF type:complete len:314 (+),score=52.39 TRINITY_DN14865_c0_g1_i1:103-1044(+)